MLRISDGKKSAVLGIGFNDRTQAFDFKVAVQDQQKYDLTAHTAHSAQTAQTADTAHCTYCTLHTPAHCSVIATDECSL